jgi:hypothetical protein
MYENGTLAPNGLLASSHDGMFPDYNKVRLPMANPPPPFYHSEFIKNHRTLTVDRFFSKYCNSSYNTKRHCLDVN